MSKLLRRIERRGKKGSGLEEKKRGVKGKSRMWNG